MATQGDLLLQIIENQKADGERLARVESLQHDLRAQVVAVREAQETCPGRIAEMQRQVRRASIISVGKFLAWSAGICATAAGAITALAAIFGGR
jgi:hypothetical protein